MTLILNRALEVAKVRVHELSCSQSFDNAENKTAVTSAGSNNMTLC